MKHRQSSMTSQLGVIYARFSPRRHADKSESVEVQVELCTKYCDMNGLEVLSTFSDRGLSGARAFNRPGLQGAMKEACKKKAALVVYSMSRLSRSTRDTIELSETLGKAGADLISLNEKIDTTTAAGKMVFRMMAVMAEFEREVIAERTSDAMQRHQGMGRKMSRYCPYGFGDNPGRKGWMVVDDAEKETIQRILDLRGEGKSYNKIVDALNGDGVDCRGHEWYPKLVRTIVLRAEHLANIG